LVPPGTQTKPVKQYHDPQNQLQISGSAPRLRHRPGPRPLATRVQTVRKQFFPDDLLSNCTYSCDTERPSFSDRLRSVFGRGQSGHPGSSDSTVDSEAVSVEKSDPGSTVYATIKLVIKLLKESSDAFPPLKSATGGLSAILNHHDARPISLRLWCL